LDDVGTYSQVVIWAVFRSLQIELDLATRAEMSTPEMVDVVDRNDTVSRSATRAEVHAQGLRHRAVHILVFNPVGELYVQKKKPG